MSNTNVFDTWFVIWDVESTSNKPTEDDIISIGACMCQFDQNNELQKLGEFHTYVYTEKSIDPIAQSIHHITKQDLLGQPVLEDAVNMFSDWIRSFVNQSHSRCYFIAHNGSKFDDLILYCNFITNLLDFEQFLNHVQCNGFIDSLKLLKTTLKEVKHCQPQDSKTGRVSYALGNCYQSFCGGNMLENAHDALVDSRALFEVLVSPKVKCRININVVLNHSVNKSKTLDWVRQRAGVHFSLQEEQTRKIKLNIYEQKIQENPLLAHFSPMLEDEKYYQGHLYSQLRFCSHCMNFVRVDEHKECFVVA